MSKKLPVVCHGHSRPIVELNYSQNTPEGYYIASASKDGKPMLRQGETGDWYGTFEGHKGAVWSCVLDTPALKCATGSADFSARIWDACAGNQLHEFQHKHIVRCVSFSYDTTRLVTGGHEKILRVFDMAKPDEAPACTPVADSTIRTVGYIQDDKTILCSYADKPGIGVYDVRSMALVRLLPTDAPVTSLEVTFDRQHICTAEGRHVRVFDAGSFDQLNVYQVPHMAESASYCHSRRRFVAGGEDLWVYLYDADTGQELECNKGHHGPVHTLRWSPTYQTYASGSEDGTIRIWTVDAPAPGSAAAAVSAPTPKAS